MTIELASDNMSTSAVTANPMGLSLTNIIQAALAEYVTNMVNTAVAKAMADAKTGGLAAVLMDDTLNERIRDVIMDADLNDRIRDVINDMEFATKSDVDDKIADHCGEYDHDDFTTDADLKSKVEEVLNDCTMSISIN